MGIFRIYETLAKQNNVHIVKDYKVEGVKKIHEGTNKSILGEIEGVFFVPDGERCGRLLPVLGKKKPVHGIFQGVCLLHVRHHWSAADGCLFDLQSQRAFAVSVLLQHYNSVYPLSFPKRKDAEPPDKRRPAGEASIRQQETPARAGVFFRQCRIILCADTASEG